MQPTRMRRPRRHRWLTLSVFFVAYSVFQAVFSPSSTASTVGPSTDVDEPSSQRDNPITIPEKDEKDISTTPLSMAENEYSTRSGKKAMKGLVDEEEEEDESEKKKQKDAGYVEEGEFDDTPPTVHPLRNCTPPAIEQFPRPLMGQYARRHGGLIIHVLVCVFTFIGLAIVCDEYFVSSLDRICEELKLAPDVAGATFMAAGSSAPELATVIIGVFCAQDDIGVSGVIGSAVFNIMFVISVCALCAGTVSHLNWWPLCRDCFFYALSILVMLCTICNGYVSWPEALFMLIMYGVYCIALRFNTALERWAMTIKLPFKLPTREEQAALVTYKSAQAQPAAAAGDAQYTEVEGQTKETALQNPPYNPDGAYDNAAYNAGPTNAWDPNSSWDPNNAWGEQTNTAAQAPAAIGWGLPPEPTAPAQAPRPALSAGSTPGDAPQPQPQPQAPVVPTYYKAKEYNPETAVNPLIKPANANPLQLAFWYVAYPIHWSCRHTMPDCRGPWYPVTFLVSMLWISFYSYFMVWMITIIGFTLGIPDTVMGLTFVAAGVSVPDALSSLAVIKEGYGDMAVSNAVGSNVFDILVCLGLPWFIQTAIIQPGSHVNVISKGLVYSTLSLFSTVIFLVVATHANGWKLDRKYGAVLMVWYLLFITFASLYELNVFGDFHPPDCGSTY
ncbi:probable sodium/potassium/calcium exchanger CG1090 [Pectinophora gossypiella]|uniref:probable sodium/potassium/calcium exchanger CG1090 n=1 Tax=Pectinophora gossypiella TaxID=13191 RepID=UPI00214E2FB7|nr:probable sodium/potassium/calcium exchanger CG1090 [Pectinophora gossypiella]